MAPSTSEDPAEGSLSESPIKVLFVCLGNICRSPMAHAVFEHRVQQSLQRAGAPMTHPDSPPDQVARRRRRRFEVDSAGTGAYHTGDPPDRRTLSTLERHGIHGFTHPARKVVARDFWEFDYILAMDSDNYEDLLECRARATRDGNERQQSKGSSRVSDGDGDGMARVSMFGAYAAGGDGDDDGEDGSISGSSSSRKGGRKTSRRGGGRRDGMGEDIEDPYYGGGKGFEIAYEQCVRFSDGFLKAVVGDSS